MEDSGMLRGFDWDGADDITALPEDDLRARLEGLMQEEQALDYRRQVLLGRIYLIRAELAERGLSGLSPEDLARVLLGDSPGGAHR